MRISICILFVFSLTKMYSQNNSSTPDFYWQHGVKKYSKDIKPNVFYLTLINESLNDSIQNKQRDQEILDLLKNYELTIEHKGISDDKIGYVFYRKLIFQNKAMDSLMVKDISEKMYSYDKIQFFGPQIYDIDTYYGAGLQRTLDITFKAKTTKEAIEKIVKKYKLEVIGEFPTHQTIAVRCTNVYGLEIINLTTKIQEESCVDKTLNHLYIQNTF
ncbi:MAG: hypothetical protein AB8B65_13645 [Kordia sp.]|uniref:hypothetical protein n=1 Tax=Kordia sp. TaxID=1965332 RepID=UPI00385D60E4